MMEHKGAVAITGGSRGIGASISIEAARRGYDVAFSYLDCTHAAQVCDEIKKLGRACVAIEADVSQRHSAQLLIAAAESLGVMVGFVANAGICAGGPLVGITEESYRRHVGVNLDGTFFGIQAAAAAMIAANTAGSIVAISSISAVMGGGTQAHYCATKAGLVRAAAISVGPSGVRVNCVAPGSIGTDLNPVWSRDAADSALMLQRIPLRRFGTPADVAKCVAFLLSEDAAYITGTTITVDGGWSIHLQ
jgi:L-rhamnose 1-dehydrogenase